MTQTRAFRWISVLLRASRKISASSIKTSASQVEHKSSTAPSDFSNSDAVVPRSPAVTTYSGFFSSSAMASACEKKKKVGTKYDKAMKTT
eukprot:CCRYP_019992-RB/>CCRYP_019992-RB protein AED:0.49 eAED:1.00 QI:0/0/0/1/0/0/2/0/89